MQKIFTLIVLVVVVATIGLSAVAYITSLGNVDKTPSEISPTASPTLSPTNSATNAIIEAKSYQFSVDMGHGVVPYTCYVKNGDSSNMVIRIEMPTAKVTYIINGLLQKSWMLRDGEWFDTSSGFTTAWNSWNSSISTYKNALASWSGTGDYTYTSSEGTVRIYDIIANPSFLDSFFEHVF